MTELDWLKTIDECKDEHPDDLEILDRFRFMSYEWIEWENLIKIHNQFGTFLVQFGGDK